MRVFSLKEEVRPLHPGEVCERRPMNQLYPDPHHNCQQEGGSKAPGSKASYQGVCLVHLVRHFIPGLVGRGAWDSPRTFFIWNLPLHVPCSALSDCPSNIYAFRAMNVPVAFLFPWKHDSPEDAALGALKGQLGTGEGKALGADHARAVDLGAVKAARLCGHQPPPVVSLYLSAPPLPPPPNTVSSLTSSKTQDPPDPLPRRAPDSFSLSLLGKGFSEETVWASFL